MQKKERNEELEYIDDFENIEEPEESEDNREELEEPEEEYSEGGRRRKKMCIRDRVITDQHTFKEGLQEKSMILAQQADDITWGVLWLALIHI